MPKVGEEKVWVEAEQDGKTVVLTLKDVAVRRQLVQDRGKHNVRTSLSKIKNFPPQLVERLEQGYPIKFKMYQSAYEEML